MPNGFLVIKEKDWAGMTPEQREWAIFNTLQSLHDRLTTLERKGVFHKCCATAGGVVGGILAALSIKWVS